MRGPRIPSPQFIHADGELRDPRLLKNGLYHVYRRVDPDEPEVQLVEEQTQERAKRSGDPGVDALGYDFLEKEEYYTALRRAHGYPRSADMLEQARIDVALARSRTLLNLRHYASHYRKSLRDAIAQWVAKDPSLGDWIIRESQQATVTELQLVDAIGEILATEDFSPSNTTLRQMLQVHATCFVDRVSQLRTELEPHLQ